MNLAALPLTDLKILPGVGALMSAPTIEQPPLDILDRLDAYTSFDAETQFQIIRKLDGAVMARADWVRYGEALWNDLQDAKAEIERLRAQLSANPG